MRLTSIFQPAKWADLIRFIRHCLYHRYDVARFFHKQTFVQWCLEQEFNILLWSKNLKDLSHLNPEVGSLHENEPPLIKQLVEMSNPLPGPIIEIGTLFGHTTSRMAVWKAPHKKIITVDNYSWNPWGVDRQTHKALTRRFVHYLVETGQVELVDMGKDDFYESYRGETPSLVFLDAIHTYEETKKDIQWARRIGAKIIAGHDHTAAFPGVMQAVKEAGGPALLMGSVFVLDSPYLRRKAA